MGTAPTRLEQATYDARLLDRTTISQLVAAGYGGIGTVVGAVGLYGAAAEATAVWAAGGSAGAQASALGWDGITLPIAAFMLGTAIRQSWDDDDERRRQAAMIILRAGLGQAVEDHGRQNPNSKIIDSANDVTGLKILAGARYAATEKTFSSIYKRWWKRLNDDLDDWRGRSALAAGFSGSGSRAEPWAQFVFHRFNLIVGEYRFALFFAERA